jgi:hypothetical protein
MWTSRYGLKGFGADGYGLKTFRPNGDPKEALRINHGRLEHHSRNFYVIDGETIKVREFERLALAALNGINRVAYIGTNRSRAEYLLANHRERHALIMQIHRRAARGLRAMA